MGQSPEELRREVEMTRTELGETIDAIGDKVSPRRMVERRRARVRETFTIARDRVMGSPRTALSAVGDTASGVAASAGSVASSAVDTVRSAPEMARHETEGNPVAAGMVAFGAGLLLAALLPPSEAERQAGSTLKDKIEPLKDAAVDLGHDVAAGVQDQARHAVDDLRAHARDASEEVRSEARVAAEDVKEQASAPTGRS